MNSVSVTTVVSLFVLALFAVKGIIKNGKTMNRDDFMSVKQTYWLKGVAIFLIMNSHFYPRLGFTYAEGGPLSVVLSSGIMGVIIFILLSGYGAMVSKMTKPDYLRYYISKRIIRLLLPFLAVFLINILLLVIMGEPIHASYFYYIPLFSLPGTLNWYLKIQFVLYVVFYCVFKIVKKDEWCIVTIFVLCGLYMIVGIYLNIDRFWYESVFAFPIGMLLAKYRSHVTDLFQRGKAWFGCAAILIFFICFVPYYFKGGTLFELLFELGFLIFVVFVCLLTYGDSKLLTMMGSSSLELYLLHLVVSNTILPYFSFNSLGMVICVSIYLLYLTVSIMLAIFLNKRIAKLSRLIIQKLQL